MKTCEDYSGSCCDSCHDDDLDGWGELPEVYDANKELFARVCCKKLDAATDDAEGVGR